LDFYLILYHGLQSVNPAASITGPIIKYNPFTALVTVWCTCL